MRSIKKIAKRAISSLCARNKSDFLDLPVFVVACGRSGSSAMCQALSNHPQISMASPEAPLIPRVGQIAFDYAYGKNCKYLQDSIQLTEQQFRQTLKNQCYTSVFGVDFGLKYNPLTTRRQNSVFRANLQKKYWGAKTFPTQEAAQGLLWLYPNAKFIYLFRNGLDVVNSMSKFGSFAKLDFPDRCRFWSERVFQYEYLNVHEKALCVKFEDFLTDNVNVFERIFSHLGIASDSRLADFASSTLVHPLDNPTSKTNPMEVLLKGKKGYEDWTIEQRIVFKEICADVMMILSYEIPF